MKANGGFTLVEVIATGVISTVLAGAVLTLLYMGTSQTEEFLARQKAIATYNVVSDQIQETARQAHVARSTNAGPLFPAWPPDDLLQASTVGLYFYGPLGGDPIGGYRIGQPPNAPRHILYERVGPTWRPFTVGRDDVFVTPNLLFRHSADRREIRFEVLVQYLVGGEARTLKMPVETAYLRTERVPSP